MTNLEKYNVAFKASFGVEDADLPALTYQGIPAWDSVGHMQLIAELEETFDIMFETEDVIEFSSYEKGKEFMAKYKIII